MSQVHLSRRGFLLGTATVAGALGLGLSLRASAATAFSPNVFVTLHPDGRLQIVCHRSEMGQGVRSSIPALIGFELGADPARIEVVQADGDASYGDQNTDGSRSIRARFEGLRLLGASARELLLMAAAQRWDADASTLTAREHSVVHPDGRSLGFGALALEAAALTLPHPDAVPLREDLPLDGLDLPLVDADALVRGTATFGADPTAEGMAIAVIARPPSLGDSLDTVDDSAARAVPGVIDVLTLPSPQGPPGFSPLGGVAVLATNTWAAMQGRKALELTWKRGDNATFDSATWEDELEQRLAQPGTVQRQVGDLDKLARKVKRTVSATYRTPLLIHAPMEPPAALAVPTDEGMEIWACTQTPQSARREVARALGLDESAVAVHVTLLGAAFGRKSKPDFCVEAALLAKQAGRPVRVQWTREDEIRHGYYHASSLQRLEVGLDKKGRPLTWLHRIASPTIGSTFSGADELRTGELGQGVFDLPLDIPAVSVQTVPAPAHLRIGWMRSVYNINHAFSVQSFLHELSVALERPHVEVLREVLGAPRVLDPAAQGVEQIPNYGAPLEEHPVDVARHHRVLDRLTALTETREPSEELGFGLAAHHSFLTTVAIALTVRDAGGQPRVDEVWVVCDPGRIVNHDRVLAQLEGAVLFGLSVALHGEISVREGQVQQSNFHDFRVARLTDAPRKIHIELICDRERPGGIGEPGVPPVAPALANAWFDLTGQRVRRLPFSASPRR